MLTILFTALTTVLTSGVAESVPSTFDEGPEPHTMFVLVSFDATPRGDVPPEEYHFVQMLERVRAAAPEGFAGPRPSFTMFFNTILLQLRRTWTPPSYSSWSQNDAWKALIKSDWLNRSRVVGHGRNPDTIATSVRTLKHLGKMGVELASHGVQHEGGRGWSRAQWEAEFNEHARILDLHDLPTPAGFRAPFLQTSIPGPARARDAAFQVMQAHGMRYDSSKVGRVKPRWPQRVGETGIWELEVPMYLRGERPFMLFGAAGSNRWGFIHILRQQFELRYYSDRAPLVLGGHGEFADMTERFLIEVCYRPGVRCATYSEFVEYLECHPELDERKPHR